MKKLFTIFIDFEDHLVGIHQVESDTANNALLDALKNNQSLEYHDRDLLIKSLQPLIKFNDDKGLWSYYFNPDVRIVPEDRNLVLGGHIVQTDSQAS